MWWTKWKSRVSIMSGSPRPPGSFNEELLFADDVFSPFPDRPLMSPQPIASAKKSSAVAPSGPAKPKAPVITIFDPSRLKMRTSPEAFRINPYWTKGYSLPRGKTPVRAQGPYMPGGRRRRFTRRGGRAIRSRKVSRPSTRRFLRR
jgi:hypothetical protein